MVLLPAAEDGLRFLGSYTLMKSALAPIHATTPLLDAYLPDYQVRPVDLRGRP